jgi:ribosomal protein L23
MASTSTNTIDGFEVLDEAPDFKTKNGREKSGLRQAMEQLPVGKSLVTGLTVSGESPATKEDKNVVARVRQKAAEINNKHNMRGMFSVKVDVDNRVIVSRNEGRANTEGVKTKQSSAN